MATRTFPWTVALPVALVATALGCAGDPLPPAISGQAVDDVPLGPDPFGPDSSFSDSGLPPRGVNPYPRYDLSFVLPYNDPEQTFTVDVEPRAGRLDVHFSIDTTGSFGGEIQALKRSLQDTLIPQLRMRVNTLAIGVSRFGDFPVRPFGMASDRPYDLLSPVTTDFDRAARAVFSLDRPLQNGGDPPESWIEALYQIATGAGLAGGPTAIERFRPRPDVPGAGTAGGVGFREGSARVVVNVTDAPAHDASDYGTAVPGAHTMEQAAAALRAAGVRAIGIASGEPARAQLQYFAMQTGAAVPPDGGRCLTGFRGASRPPVSGVCPLVFDIGDDGTGLADTTVDAITRFLDSLAFRSVTGTAEGDVRGFVTRLEAFAATPPAGASQPRREDRLPAAMPDGVAETFSDVATRTRLSFRVHLRNTRVQSEEYPQLFFLRVLLTGDGFLVGERVVRVIVPEGPKPDSGVDAARDQAAADAPPAPSDASALDASPDAPPDASPDAPADVAPDASVDAPEDADAPDAAPADGSGIDDEDGGA